jgi:hypothetical protein
VIFESSNEEVVEGNEKWKKKRPRDHGKEKKRECMRKQKRKIK